MYSLKTIWVSQFSIDALYTSVWSWIGADLGLCLDVYVADSSHIVVLIAARLWSDVFFSPHILSVIFRNCLNWHRELFFKVLCTCAYLVLQLLIILHFAVYICIVSFSSVNYASCWVIRVHTLFFSRSFQFAHSPTWLMRKLVTVQMFGGSVMCPLHTFYIHFHTLVSSVHSGTMCKTSPHGIMTFSIL